jgi:hypothetical protein
VLVEIEISIEIPDLGEALALAEAEIIRAALPGMVEEMETIRTNSMEVVPVDSGDLRNSALVVGVNPEIEEEGSAQVMIGYGGVASAYAIEQHENPNFRHAEGKTWKYLEIPTMNAINGMGERLADHIRSALGGGGDAAS